MKLSAKVSYVDKFAVFAEGMEAAFADLTPLSGQNTRRLQTMIPVGSGGSKTKDLTVPAAIGSLRPASPRANAWRRPSISAPITLKSR